MNKLLFHSDKVLRLNNVLQYRIQHNEDINVNVLIGQIETYIKTKGVSKIGPLIQYTKMCLNRKNELEVEAIIMIQCSDYIHSVENPYSMHSVIRVPNSMYCRYVGPENKLKFAYDKIYLEAFENDIELEDYNYTIFVDRLDENIVADVFIPKKIATDL